MPSVMASLVRTAPISAVDALSTRLTIFSSRIVAFPDALPPPSDGLLSMPHDQLRTSISSLCLSSRASPLIGPALAPLTLNNMSPAPAGRAVLPPVPFDTGTGSAFLLRLHVVLEVDPRVERSVGFLRLVLDVDLREGERDVLGVRDAV